MLVVSNGIVKSGSSWLTLIAGRLVDFDDLPDQFRESAWENVSLIRPRLREFLHDGHADQGTYLVKNHFALSGERNVMLFSRSCKVIMTFRDMRDSVVSRYFHYKRIGEIDEADSFLDFFWSPEPPNGRQTLEYMTTYVGTWDLEDDSLWKVRYEELHTDLEETIRSLASFLEVDPAAVDFDDVVRRSEPRAQTQPNGNAHIRAGRPGDWQNYFGELELEYLHAMVPERIHHLVLVDGPSTS